MLLCRKRGLLCGFKEFQHPLGCSSHCWSLGSNFAASDNVPIPDFRFPFPADLLEWLEPLHEFVYEIAFTFVGTRNVFEHFVRDKTQCGQKGTVERYVRTLFNLFGFLQYAVSVGSSWRRKTSYFQPIRDQLGHDFQERYPRFDPAFPSLRIRQYFLCLRGELRLPWSQCYR